MFFQPAVFMLLLCDSFLFVITLLITYQEQMIILCFNKQGHYVVLAYKVS